ncbi:ankyrin repeat-containing domain protein [Zopfochytrium polystomum]|nr:ankyrin repeat-containing domain protein [Zopfochytrium polystomum]
MAGSIPQASLAAAQSSAEAPDGQRLERRQRRLPTMSQPVQQTAAASSSEPLSLKSLPVEMLQDIAARGACLAGLVEFLCICRKTSSVLSTEVLAAVILGHTAENLAPSYSGRLSKEAVVNAALSNLHSWRGVPPLVLSNVSVRLVELGADPCVKDSLPLTHAILTQDQEAICLFLSRSRFNFSKTMTTAVQTGNIEIVKLVRAAEPDEAATDLSSTLITAVKGKHTDIVQYLVSHCTFHEEALDSALRQAVQTPDNDVTIASILLESGASVAPAHATPPIIITMSPASVRLLIAAGSDPRIRNDATLLNMVKCGDYETVRWLVEVEGADPHVDGDHALWLAASYGKEDIVRWLLSMGCSPNARRTGGGRSADDRTPRPPRPWLLGGSVGVPVWVRGLLPYRRVNRSRDSGPTAAAIQSANVLSPLAEAATRGHIGVVQLLIDNGVEVIHDHAVLLAAMNGHVEIVELLMAAGADDFMERTGRLIYASGKGDLKVMRECLRLRDSILSTGRSSFAASLSSSSAVSSSSSPTAIPDYRLNPADVHYLNDAALLAACKAGSAAAVGLLIRFGANVHARSNAAIGIAAECGFDDVLSLLIRAGADVNAGSPSPLSIAAIHGHVSTVRILINSGAHLDGLDLQSFILNRSNKLNHLLCDVIEAGHVAVARLLLETKKFNINIRSSLVGEDLLTAAFRGTSIDMVSLLLDFGADPEPHRMWTVYESAAMTDKQARKALFEPFTSATGSFIALNDTQPNDFEQDDMISELNFSRSSAAMATVSPAHPPFHSWSPERGFLKELIRHPARNHSGVVRRLARCGAYVAARRWGRNYGVSDAAIQSIVENSRQSLLQLIKKASEDDVQSNSGGLVLSDSASDASAIGAAVDPFGGDDLYDPSIWNNHTVLEHAATWCGYSLIRDLSVAGESLVHGGSAALARATAREGTAALPIIVALIDAGVDPCEGIRSACAHGRVDFLRCMIREGVQIGRLGVAEADHASRVREARRKRLGVAVGDEPAPRPHGEVLGAVAAAVRSGKVEVLEFLLKECGLSPDGTPDPTPFVLAAIESSRAGGGTVFDRHNLHPLHRSSPLRLAVQAGNLQMCRLLLSFGADVRLVRHITLLAVKSKFGTSGLAILELLLEAGASPDRDDRCSPNISLRDSNGQSPIPSVDSSRSSTISADFAIRNVEAEPPELIPGFTQSDSEIPLVAATRSGELPMIKALIQAGADVDAGDGAAASAAVRMQDDSLVAFFEKAGADPFGLLRGRLMLHVEYASVEGVKEVLEREKAIKSGWRAETASAGGVAIVVGSPNRGRMFGTAAPAAPAALDGDGRRASSGPSGRPLRPSHAGPTTIELSRAPRRPKLVEVAGSRSPTRVWPSLIDVGDGEAVRRAAALGHYEILKLLLEYSASTTTSIDGGGGGGAADASNSSSPRYSARACVVNDEALCVACQSGHASCVRLLLQNGANVRARDNEPLMAAAVGGWTTTVAELLKAGADPRAREGGVYRAAVAAGKRDVVKMMRRASWGLSTFGSASRR